MLERQTITEEALMDKLHDIDISDQELAQYFIESPDVGDALAPVIIPNPELVRGSHFEGALVLNWFNNIARWRRNKIYKRRMKNWTGIRVVAEGDSWFQYPLKLKDVIDQLIDTENFEYAIYGLSEAGDLLKNMVREDEICEAVERENPHILLISGGGNDMVGGERIKEMVHKFTPSRQPGNYPNANFKAFLDELEHLYRQLFDRLLRMKPHLKIFCHGYDHAIPDKGRWLGKPLAKAKIEKKNLQQNIIAEMIDRFNQRLITVAGDYPGAVYHVDCRKAVTPSSQWYDELHPTDAGYFEVAKRFDRIIKQALQNRTTTPSIRIPLTRDPVEGKTERRAGAHSETVTNVQQLDHAAFLNLVFKRARQNNISANLQPPASEYERRQLEKDIERHFEKVHMGADFLPISFLEKGVERAQAVCRIVTSDSLGSGFLIATRNFIMTNNHVLDSSAKARGSKAQFDYDEDDLLYEIQFDPDRLFITDRELDFTIVACKSETLPENIMPIQLLQDPETVTRNERVNIIQHPKGRRKELSLHDNKVTYVYDKVIRYTADTQGGSSGSPVFNNQWDLVALHHAGWSAPDGSASNEGVRMTAIVSHLLGEQATESSSALESLIQTVASKHPGKPGSGVLTPAAPRSIRSRPETGKALILNMEADINELTLRIR
jgi:V8-like Glu-specific endopeptidase